MSDQNINQQESREQEQSSETLLVVDKKKKKVQAVKGINKKGELETVDADKKNQNQFMRVDKHGDMFSNFYSNFLSQLKDPTRFSFFRVPKIFAVDIAKIMQENIGELIKTGRELIKEYKQEIQNSMETTATTKEYRYQPEQIDWKAMSDLGLNREKLEKMKILEPLLKGYKTNLISLSFNTEQTAAYMDARLSLRQNADGKVGINIHGIRKEPHLISLSLVMSLPKRTKKIC